jgi:hypothetical protein
MVTNDMGTNDMVTNDMGTNDMGTNDMALPGFDSNHGEVGAGTLPVPTRHAGL